MRRLAQLELRVGRVEEAVVSGLALLSVLLLAGGLLAPYLVVDGSGDGSGDGDLPAARLLTMPFHALASGSGSWVVLGVGYAVLLGATSATLAVAGTLVLGTATLRTGRAASIASALQLLATTLAALVALVYLGDGDGARPGVGVVLVGLGALAHALVTFSPVRTWWDPARDLSSTGSR